MNARAGTRFHRGNRAVLAAAHPPPPPFDRRRRGTETADPASKEGPEQAQHRPGGNLALECSEHEHARSELMPSSPPSRPSKPRRALPPHPATVAQPGHPFWGTAQRAPHPATMVAQRAPHPATVAQRRVVRALVSTVQLMEVAVAPPKTLQSFMLEIAKQALKRDFLVSSDDDEKRVVTADERFLSFCFYFFDPEPTYSRELAKQRNQYVNPRDYGSCAPFAKQMACILGYGEPVVQCGSKFKKQFLRSLANDLVTYAKLGSFIFTVTHGIHGFSFVTRLGHVELIQVFAGPSGFSIATSILQNKVYTPDALADLLNTFDKNAQEALFGGTIDNDEATYRSEYCVYALANDAEERIKKQFAARRELFNRLKLHEPMTVNWS